MWETSHYKLNEPYHCCIFGFPKFTHCVCWWRLAIAAGGLSAACQFQYNPWKLTRGKLLMKHMYIILLTWCNGYLRHLGLGEQVSNTTNGTRSKSTKRTSKVASNGFMFLAFEVCWSRGPDGIRYSDGLRSIWEGITWVWSVLWHGCIFQMMYGLKIALSTTNMESLTSDEAICDSSYEEYPPFPGHLHLRRGWW